MLSSNLPNALKNRENPFPLSYKSLLLFVYSKMILLMINTFVYNNELIFI